MRIAVLSDIHANLVALEAVLGAIGEVDALWELGDVVGYGPDPSGVVRRLQAAGAIGVLGNHDAAAIGGNEIDYFNVDAKQAMVWTRRSLDDAARAWLEGLPETVVSGDFTLAHGSPRDPIWEYLTSRSAAEANFSAFETPYCFVGHTHVPAAFCSGPGLARVVDVAAGTVLELGSERVILNPGSVGQPRDGDPAASYLLLDTTAGTATWHRVAYDVAVTQRAMEQAGLPPRLIRRLSAGY